MFIHTHTNYPYLFIYSFVQSTYVEIYGRHTEEIRLFKEL